MTLIALVRHGQTDWNLAGRIQGSTDIPLNDTGRAQAREAGVQLETLAWDRLLASPLSRAVETAELIGASLGLSGVETIAAIAERGYGLAEGLTGAELQARFGDHVPGRETPEQVVARTVPALLGLAERYPEERLVVVSHGGVISNLLRHLTAHRLPRAGEFVRNGSVHLFRVEAGALRLEHYAGDAPLSEAFSA